MKRENGRFGFTGKSTSYKFLGVNDYKHKQGRDVLSYFSNEAVEREYQKFAPADKDEQIKE